MTVVKYGSGELEFTLETDPAALLRAAGPPHDADRVRLPGDVASALATPTDGTAALAARLSPRRPVTVVVSDLTRSWIPSARLVGALSPVFARAGIPDKQVTILVATGTHRPHTPAELASLVGSAALARFTVLDHDCRAAELVSFGSTSHGTPVALNPLVSGEAQVILTGGLSFHLMCGFGGGRKSVCPGVAGYATIQANHRLVLAQPDGRAPSPGELADNLMHADLMETAALVNPLFLINALPVNEDGVERFVSGDWRGAWEQGCRLLEAESRIDVGEPADVVLAGAGGYPHDLDLYQTVKALVHVQEGVRPGGALIMASHCGEGLGGGPEFARNLAYGLAEAEQRLKERFTVPAYAAYRLRQLAERLTVVLVSSLPPRSCARPACCSPVPWTKPTLSPVPTWGRVAGRASFPTPARFCSAGPLECGSRERHYAGLPVRSLQLVGRKYLGQDELGLRGWTTFTVGIWRCFQWDTVPYSDDGSTVGVVRPGCVHEASVNPGDVLPGVSAKARISAPVRAG